MSDKAHGAQSLNDRLQSVPQAVGSLRGHLYNSRHELKLHSFDHNHVCVSARPVVVLQVYQYTGDTPL